jgi:ABC-type sugar transport system ATPase subunit
MGDEFRALQRRLRITTLYVTHDQEEAMALSDRVVVMDKGRALQVGAPEEVYRRPASRPSRRSSARPTSSRPRSRPVAPTAATMS